MLINANYAKVAEIVFKEESYRTIGLILNCMEHGAWGMGHGAWGIAHGAMQMRVYVYKPIYLTEIWHNLDLRI